MMNQLNRKQEGAFMVLMAIMIVALLGFAALAIDVGRILVLRAEMQNAVDAAALAAAKQLDGGAGARERARANAKNALVHNSHFGKIQELLSATTLPDNAFTFFCIIGSEPDLDPDNNDVDLTKFCSSTTPYASTGIDSEKLEALNDEEARYVRVNLSPDVVDVDNFSINMIFLPVLNLLGADQFLTEIALSANALAGRNQFACNFPPIMICDPFEDEGTTFREAMAGREGASILLKKQGPGAAWAPGNFGLLDFTGGDTPTTTQQLADETDVGCIPSVVDTNPGNKTPVRSGINVRFGIYDDPDEPVNHYDGYGPVHPSVKGKSVEYPPAPHISDFPQDAVLDANRIGNGVWNCLTYWTVDQGHSLASKPPGCFDVPQVSSVTRWDVYNYELDRLEAGDPGVEEGPIRDGLPPGERERRLIWVAVMSCDALGVHGSTSDVSILNPDGFAEIFLTAPVSPAPDADLYGEYIRWGTEDDGFLHVDVQLYE